MSSHISISRMDLVKRTVERCPVCKCRRRFFSWFQDYYGWHSTCLGCGDSWQNGEMMTRPFARGWRMQAIADAKHQWKTAKGRFSSIKELISQTERANCKEPIQ